jgi:preprotein translocase subunit SecF
MINIVGKRFWFFLGSGIVLLFCIISLANFGLKPGIELSSGSMLTVHFEQTVTEADLKQELASLGYTGTIVQHTAAGDYLIRTSELTSEAKTALEEALKARFGPITESEFYSVSPMVAAETARNAGIAIAIASVGILLYVTWAFRKMPNPFRYGACAIIALGHDALVVLGIFSMLGHMLGWEINLMFITGLLAAVGYSVNDTVVVFDRIRENLRLGISPSFEVVVNTSVVETLGRSLNTSFTTLITVLALVLFVGASIQNFAVVLLIGIVTGTYSSIFIASTLLVVWEKGEWGRFFRRRPLPAKSQ